MQSKKAVRSTKTAVKKAKSAKGLKGSVLRSSKSSKVSKTTKNSKSKKSSSLVGKKKAVSSSVKLMKKKKDVSQSKQGQNIKAISRKKAGALSGKQSWIVDKKKAINKEDKKRLALENMEKRKIMEFKKELENLNKKKQEEVLIRDAEGRLYCHDEKCDQPAVTDIYCRYHYLALWKYLQTKKKLLEEKYLSHTIQELIKSFGEGALHFTMRDFKNEKTFEMAAREMSFSTGKEEDTINSEVDTHF